LGRSLGRLRVVSRPGSDRRAQEICPRTHRSAHRIFPTQGDLSSDEEPEEDFDYDEPLGTPEKEVANSNFLKAYGWPKALDPRRMGCDALLGRVYREFVRLTMTLYAVSNVKVLAQARKGQPAKKHRVHSRLSFETHEPGEDADVGAPGVRGGLHGDGQGR